MPPGMTKKIPRSDPVVNALLPVTFAALSISMPPTTLTPGLTLEVACTITFLVVEFAIVPFSVIGASSSWKKILK